MTLLTFSLADEYRTYAKHVNTKRKSKHMFSFFLLFLFFCSRRFLPFVFSFFVYRSKRKSIARWTIVRTYFILLCRKIFHDFFIPLNAHLRFQETINFRCKPKKATVFSMFFFCWFVSFLSFNDFLWIWLIAFVVSIGGAFSIFMQ